MNKFVIGINKVIVIFLKQYFYNRKEHKSNFFTSFLGLQIKSASCRIYQYIYLNGYFCGYSVDELDCCWQTIFSSDYANIPPSSSLSFVSLLVPLFLVFSVLGTTTVGTIWSCCLATPLLPVAKQFHLVETSL